MVRMLSLLARRPGYRRLWLGELISLMGDWLSYVAVSLLALRTGGGALSLALVFAAHALPSALVSPLAGWLADRFDRKSLLVGSQLAQAALTGGMLLAAVNGELVALQATLFLRNTLAGVVHPAKQAAMTQLLEGDELVDANALDAATWSLSFTLGTALGGVMATLDPFFALAIDTLSFIVAAWILAGLPSLAVRRENGAPLRMRGSMRAALRHALERPGLFEAVFAKTPMAVAGGAGWVLLNLTAGELGGAAGAGLALGLLQAVRGAGTGVGPLLAKNLTARGISVAALLRASVALSLLSVALFALAGGWALLLALVLLWGMGGGGSWVFSSSAIQQLSSESFVGRTSALDQLAFTLGMASAALATGLAIDAGIGPASAVLAAVAFGGALYVGMLLVQPPHPRRQAASTAGAAE
jgi:MFS family permease